MGLIFEEALEVVEWFLREHNGRLTLEYDPYDGQDHFFASLSTYVDMQEVQAVATGDPQTIKLAIIHVAENITDHYGRPNTDRSNLPDGKGQ